MMGTLLGILFCGAALFVLLLGIALACFIIVGDSDD